MLGCFWSRHSLTTGETSTFKHNLRYFSPSKQNPSKKKAQMHNQGPKTLKGNDRKKAIPFFPNKKWWVSLEPRWPFFFNLSHWWDLCFEEMKEIAKEMRRFSILGSAEVRYETVGPLDQQSIDEDSCIFFWGGDHLIHWWTANDFLWEFGNIHECSSTSFWSSWFLKKCQYHQCSWQNFLQFILNLWFYFR